jgi:hypothetical protein
MPDGGSRMTNAVTERATHVSRVPERGWPPSAFRALTSKSRMRSKIKITRKIRTQFAALPCALHPLPDPDLDPDVDLDLDPDPPRPPLHLCRRFLAMHRRGGEKPRRNGASTSPGCQKVGGPFRYAPWSSARSREVSPVQLLGRSPGLAFGGSGVASGLAVLRASSARASAAWASPARLAAAINCG